MSLSRNSKTALPIEILDHILGDLDGASHDGRSSLLACSYASRTLGYLAQKRIFRDLVISVKVFMLYFNTTTTFYEDNDGLTTGRKLLDVLDMSPHMASYIQSITVTDVVQPAGLSQSLWCPGLNSIKSDSSEFPLYIITARAQNLKKLIFSLSSLDAPHSFWPSMQPRMQDFFTQLAQRLPGIGFHPFERIPMSIFHSSVVEELQISHMDMDTSVVPSSKVKLKSLDLLYRPSIDPSKRLSWFNHPSSAFEITDLQTLKVSRSTFPLLEDILVLCSKSLRSLTLQAINGRSWFKYGSELVLLLEQGIDLELGSLRSLSELTIGAYFINRISHLHATSTETVYDTDLLHIFRALKTIPCNTAISQTLRINVCIRMGNIPQSLLELIPWSTLICGPLNEEEMKARWANLRLRFRMVTVDGQLVDVLGIWSPRDILDRHEDLKNLRLKGLLSY